MADLRDNIRLTTVADLQALTDLAFEYKKLGLTISDVANGSRLLTAQYKKDAQDSANATKLTTDEIKKQSTALDATKKSTDALSSSISSLTGLRSQVIGLFGAFSIGSFGKSIIDAQSQIQAFDLSMNNLLGADYGKLLTDNLKKFTVSTPLNFEQVIKSSNQLVGSFKAAGKSSEEIATQIPKVLESLGNSAAALGGDDRLGRLTYAFSQVQATGRLMGTEVRQITETGFPLLAVMAQTTGKSVSQLQDDIHKGKISFEQFSKAILSAGNDGGVFAGSMDIMANTIKGRLEKLGETFFFVKGKIGEFFKSSAIAGIDFANSLLKSLFGTDEAIQKTIGYAKALTTLVLAYYAAGAANAAWVVAQKAYLVLKGQLILATETYIGMTIAETEAQIAAKNAAIGFNTVMKANPIGLVIGLLGTAIAAYQLYTSSVEDATKVQSELNGKIADALAPLKISEDRFNRLAKSITDASIPMDEQRKRLDRLKEIYPDILKGADSLAEAEGRLQGKNLQGNSTYDYRLDKFKQLKAEFPIQLKGIDNLKDAEQKLGSVIRDTNADFIIRAKLLENEVRINVNREKATNWIKEQIELEKQLTTASRTRADIITPTGNGFIKTGSAKSEAQLIEESIAARKRWVENAMKTNGDMYDIEAKLTNKLIFEYEKQNTNLEAAGKEGKEKALKFQADTAEQKRLANIKIWAEDLDDSRQKDLILKNTEYKNQQERIKNAIGSQKTKNKMLLDLEQDYDATISKLHQTWDEKDRKEATKAIKDKNKALETEAMKSAETMWKIIEDRINDEVKEEKRATESIKKLKEKAQKDQIELTEKGYDIEDKLRTIELLKKGASLKQIERFEKDSAAVRETQQKDESAKRLRVETDLLEEMKSKGLEGTEAYLQQLSRKNDANKDYNDSYKNYLKAQINAEIEALRKREEVLRTTVGIISDITSEIFSKIEKDIDESLSKTTDAVKKNRLEEIKTETGLVKDFVSVAAKAATGDFAGAITQGAMLIFKTVSYELNRAAEFEKAVIERQQNLLKKYAETAKETITGILSQVNEVSDVYAKFKDNPINTPKKVNGQYLTQLQAEYYVLQQQAKALIAISETLGKRGSSLTELISKETEYGQAISDYYEKVVKDENDRFDNQISNLNKAKDASIDFENTSNDEKVKNIKETFDIAKDAEDKLNDEKVKNINSNYDKEVDNINRLYDYKNTKLNQAYDAETLGILAAGSKQLEALITNEDSLSSVRAEFAAKRLQIEEAFPLAYKRITEGMSDAEIAAINASIKARDEALSKLQGWYNDELTFIVNNEGQKRKEYTETEKIALQIKDNLYKASLKFAEDEIIIERDKQIELVAAALKKDTAIELQAKVHNTALEAINFTYKTNIEIQEAAHLANIKIIEDKYKSDKEVAEQTHANNILAINKKRDEDLLASFQRLTNGIEVELNRVSNLLGSMKDKTSDEYKALQAELQKLIDKYKELTGLSPTITIVTSPSTPSPNIPRGFEKGTDNTSVSMSGQPRVDSRGGWNATIHPDEAIFSKADMTQMTRFMGKRPTRDEVIERFKVGTKMIDSNSFIQKISPYVLSKSQGNTTIDIQGLRDDLSKLTREVVKRQQPLVQIDKNGIRTYMSNINSQIEIKNNKFAS